MRRIPNAVGLPRVKAPGGALDPDAAQRAFDDLERRAKAAEAAVREMQAPTGVFSLGTPRDIVLPPGDLHGWVVPGFNEHAVFRVTAAADFELTGIAGGTDGRTVLLIVRGVACTVRNESSLSRPGDRILLPASAASLAIGGASSTSAGGIWLHYDGTISRWTTAGPQ